MGLLERIKRHSKAVRRLMLFSAAVIMVTPYSWIPSSPSLSSPRNMALARRPETTKYPRHGGPHPVQHTLGRLSNL